MVLVCGSHNWTDEDAVREELSALPTEAILLTRGVFGAVEVVTKVAGELNIAIEHLPADWPKDRLIERLQRIGVRPQAAIVFGDAPLIDEAKRRRVSLTTVFA